MAAPVVASVGTFVNPGSNVCTPGVPSGVASGSSVVAVVTGVYLANITTTTGTITVPSGWTCANAASVWSPSDGVTFSIWFCYKYATGADTGTYSFTANAIGGNSAIATDGSAMRITGGPASGNPFVDTFLSTGNATASTTITHAATTPGGNDSLLVAKIASDGPTSVTVPSGWSALSGGTGMLSTLSQSTAASTGTLTWTFNSSAAASLLSIGTIRPPAGGPTSASAASSLALTLAATAQARASATIVLSLASAATGTGVVPTTASAHIDLSAALAAYPKANASATLPTQLAVQANAAGVAIASAHFDLALADAAIPQGRASASLALAAATAAATAASASATLPAVFAVAAHATGTATASARFDLALQLHAAAPRDGTDMFAFYARHSGLTAGNLVDHYYAYWARNSPLPQGTVDDHINAALTALFATPHRDSQDLLYDFYDQDGLGGTVDDAMVRFFAADNDPFGG